MTPGKGVQDKLEPSWVKLGYESFWEFRNPNKPIVCVDTLLRRGFYSQRCKELEVQKCLVLSNPLAPECHKMIAGKKVIPAIERTHARGDPGTPACQGDSGMREDMEKKIESPELLRKGGNLGGPGDKIMGMDASANEGGKGTLAENINLRLSPKSLLEHSQEGKGEYEIAKGIAPAYNDPELSGKGDPQGIGTRLRRGFPAARGAPFTILSKHPNSKRNRGMSMCQNTLKSTKPR